MKLTNLTKENFTIIDIFILSIFQYIEYLLLFFYIILTLWIYYLAHIIKLIIELLIFLLEQWEKLISWCWVTYSTIKSMRKWRWILIKNILKFLNK